MILYLLRHAIARPAGSGPDQDRDRPLAPAGQQQAQAVATALRDAGIRRVLSSPALRCLETLAPLAEACPDVVIERDPRLLEGASLHGLLDLVKELGDEPTLLCSHGDLIPELIEHFRRSGLRLASPPRCQTGSTWRIEHRHGTWSARYLPALDVPDV